MENKETTLEEAKENAWNNYEHQEGNLYSTAFNSGFELGVKWIKERSYSEEEVLKAQQAILGNIKDAMQDEDYIIEYLKKK